MNEKKTNFTSEKKVINNNMNPNYSKSSFAPVRDNKYGLQAQLHKNSKYTSVLENMNSSNFSKFIDTESHENK
ncbi:hypothetical protein [Exiguobacterium sp. ERU656]|uniref:hypothetical protein n=1 Tax=Exiguobacterium sp. ERU656 TaxID=2751217 RepID=UPI001BE807AF|nr:hypothetical protein [Exiguobacterium sp. ERU656]